MIDFKKYEGIKFKTRSFNKDEGLDCLTFILYFLKTEYNYDFDINNVPEYNSLWLLHKETRSLYYDNIKKYCDLIPFKPGDQIDVGNLLLFSFFNESKSITHVGIYIGNNEFIHCVEDLGVCITKLSNYFRVLKWVGVVINEQNI